MARPVGTTEFTVQALATDNVPSTYGRRPPPKKRKLTRNDDVIDLTEDDTGVDTISLWRHRLALTIPKARVNELRQHLHSITNGQDKIEVKVELELRRSNSKDIEYLVATNDDDPIGLFYGRFPCGDYGEPLQALFQKLETRKCMDEFKVSWSLLLNELTTESPHIILEFDLRRIDSGEINWQSEKWISVFLGLTTEAADRPFDISKLSDAIKTTAKRQGDIEARDFYQSVYVPDVHTKVPEMIQVSELTTEMFPFQKRTVDWMLRREGVTAEKGGMKPLPVKPDLTSLCIQECVDYDGEKYWTSVPLGITTGDEDRLRRYAAEFQVNGGILAEEMGLGKTVELISLLSLHKRTIPAGQETLFDAYTGVNVRASGSTLIICPPSIMQQWVSELQLHAPSLRVFRYNGTRDLLQIIYNKKKGNGKRRVGNDRYLELSTVLQDISNVELVEHLLQYDIILSSYNVLAQELPYAERPPDRKMRNEKKYERRSCPLVEISWWRVCLDEAQMIESGVSNAAQVARLIPRVNAWAVTGTPVQKSTDDLFGLLVFLRQHPWCGTKAVWEKLCFQKSGFRDVFRSLALGHTKDMVHEEIKLPRQHRTSITLGFSQVEEANYQRLFEQACYQIGVYTDGSPGSGTWDPTSEEVRNRMRTWLVRLRQTCVHPQVGVSNRRALGGGQAELRTVDEVLDIMIQQNTMTVKQDQRTMFMLIAAVAQITLESDKEPQAAIDLLMDHLPGLNTAVEECRKEVAAEEERREVEKATLKEKENERAERAKDKAIAAASHKDMELPDTIDNDYTEKPPKEAWEESDDEDDEDDVEGHGMASELNKLKNRLRDILEVEHIYHFYIGTAYFNLKDKIPEDDEEQKDERKRLEDLENKHYEEAKKLRKELMSEPENKVLNNIETIKRRTDKQEFVEIPEIIAELQKGGIESNSIMEDIAVLAEKLNDQANLLDEWRERLIQLLQAPLVDDQDEEADGEELQHSAEAQDEGFLYVALIRTVISDRVEAVSGLSSNLANAEMKTARERAEGQDDKHKELFQELEAKREDVRPVNVDGDIVTGESAMPYSFKGLLAKLRRLAAPGQITSSSARAKAEAGLVSSAIKALQPMLAKQEKVAKALEKEVGFLSDAFNARVEFYRQLQVVSDMVAQFDEKKELKANHVRQIPQLVLKHQNEIKRLSDTLSRFKSMGRYLQHLKESDAQSQRLCIICQGDVEIGVITICGHQFCKECMEAWWNMNHTCPTCKKVLKKVDLHPVTYKDAQVTIQQETKDSSASNSSLMLSHGGSSTGGLQIYTALDAHTFNQIKTIRLTTSYGSKIDMIIRHLLWIRRYTPGSKSVIFSQWKEVLEVFQKALRDSNILFSSLEDKGGLNKFKTDPQCEVFLLHAKSQSAGLTLVAASNVFLCEPLVNTGLELQAIARVHRIGQKNETNVFLYVIGNTVEEGVYKYATKRRLEMMGTGPSSKSPAKRRRNNVCDDDDPKGKKRRREDVANKKNEVEDGSTGIFVDGEGDIEMVLESANSLELMEGNLVERGQGGGEVVGNDQLWGCLFEVTRKDRSVELGVMHREEVAMRREIGAGNVVDDRWAGGSGSGGGSLVTLHGMRG